MKIVKLEQMKNELNGEIENARRIEDLLNEIKKENNENASYIESSNQQVEPIKSEIDKWLNSNQETLMRKI